MRSILFISLLVIISGSTCNAFYLLKLDFQKYHPDLPDSISSGCLFVEAEFRLNSDIDYDKWDPNDVATKPSSNTSEEIEFAKSMSFQAINNMRAVDTAQQFFGRLFSGHSELAKKYGNSSFFNHFFNHPCTVDILSSLGGTKKLPYKVLAHVCKKGY